MGISVVATVLTVAAASAQMAQVGQPAPMATVTNMAGETKSIKDLEETGAPLFLFFINTQDNTSTAAASYINKIAAAYTPSKTKWYGICNGPSDQARSYQAELNPPYQLLLDERLSSMQAYGAQTSPTIVEIGKDGNVMHIWKGYSAAMLKRLNRAVSKANGGHMVDIDFSKAPSTETLGHPYIGGQPNSGSGGG